VEALKLKLESKRMQCLGDLEGEKERYQQKLERKRNRERIIRNDLKTKLEFFGASIQSFRGTGLGGRCQRNIKHRKYLG